MAKTLNINSGVGLKITAKELGSIKRVQASNVLAHNLAVRSVNESLQYYGKSVKAEIHRLMDTPYDAQTWWKPLSERQIKRKAKRGQYANKWKMTGTLRKNVVTELRSSGRGYTINKQDLYVGFNNISHPENGRNLNDIARDNEDKYGRPLFQPAMDNTLPNYLSSNMTIPDVFQRKLRRHGLNINEIYRK